MPGKIPHVQTEACARLIQDHRHMEQLLANLENALAEPDPDRLVEKAKRVMGEVESEINTHFACEEQVLFPAVAPYHPMVLMEVEHDELIALKDSLLASLQTDKPTSETLNTVKDVGQRFIQEMLDHMGRENSGIFPTCEQALSDTEKEEVIAGIEAIRSQALKTPTPSITRPDRTFQYYSLNLSDDPQRKIMAHRIFDDAIQESKHIVIQAGEALAEHWAPKRALLICLQGEAVFSANEQSQPMTPGTIIAMTPQLRHAIQAKTRCDILLLLQND